MSSFSCLLLVFLVLEVAFLRSFASTSTSSPIRNLRGLSLSFFGLFTAPLLACRRADLPLGRVGLATPCIARPWVDFLTALAVFRPVTRFRSILVLAIAIIAGWKRKVQFKTMVFERRNMVAC